ncbi:MAG: acyl-CoA synthetase [bacterium]
MNFINDVVESFPSAKKAVVAIDRQGAIRPWHFGELFAMSAGLSGAMVARGVKRGDVVMTLCGSRIEWVLTMLACFRMGAVVMPCNPQLRKDDLSQRVSAANPGLCIGEEALLQELPDGVPHFDLSDLARIFDEDRPQEPPAVAEDLSPDDPAAIIFTSGTTGEPRGVLYSQQYLAGQRLQADHWFGAREGELAWCTAAPGWSKSTRNSFIAPWLCGATAVIHDGRFDPVERLDLIERLGVNVLCQAPTEYRIIARRTDLRPLPSIRRMVTAGEPINPEIVSEFREAVGVGPADGYGQTETGHLTGMPLGEDDPSRDGAMGKPLPGIETRLNDGVLEVRPETVPTFFSHYLGEEPFQGEWWHTGDRVREDAEGYLWFESRDDDLIISAGYRIGPFEVESALIEHPTVAEAAVVSAPDPERGSIVKAFVVVRDAEPSTSLVSELQEHVKSVTAPYKYPREIEFLSELPKTPSGKIRRTDLRGD